MPPIIRLAGSAGLEAINAIYSHYVDHSTCTYQETPEPMESRHGPRHPITVAELDGGVVG